MTEDTTKDQPKESEEAEEVAAETATQEEKPELESQEEKGTEAEAEEPAVEPPAEEEPEEEPEEELEPSPRQNKAIERLTKKLAEVSRNQPRTAQGQPPVLDEGEYEPDELNQRVSQYGDQRYQDGLALAQALAFQQDLKIDVPRVAQKYPILDRDSDNFDPGISDLINEKYLRIVGYDDQSGFVARRDIGYEEFVDAEIAIAERLNTLSRSDSAKNLASQAAKTGVRPNSVAKKPYQGADPRQMTDDQLAQAINEGLGIAPR